MENYGIMKLNKKLKKEMQNMFITDSIMQLSLPNKMIGERLLILFV